MRGVIFLGGDAPSTALSRELAAEADLIVAADGGFAYARAAGVMPHVLVGDFDSLAEELVAEARDAGCEIALLPVEKDQTDGQEALDIALGRGCAQIALLGGFGGRFDHQFTHLCLLVRALRRGAVARMEDERTVLWCLGPGEHRIAGRRGEALSILPFGEGLHIKRLGGLYYPIPDKDMPAGEPYGISNVFTEDVAVVEIASGLAVVQRNRGE